MQGRIPNTTWADWPESLTLSVTDVCNLRCVQCFHAINAPEAFHHANLDFEKARFLLRRAKIVALHGCGEPLMHPRLWDLLPDDLGYENGVGFCTNGLLFTEETVDRLFAKRIAWLDFSIDAGTPETYGKIRGGNWETLWGNIDRIVARRGDATYPLLYANMTLMAANVRDVAALLSHLALRRFGRLHILHMHEFNWSQFPEWRVPFRDGTGVFDYRAQNCLRPENIAMHDAAIREAIEVAHELDFPLLMATGVFLGENGSHRRLYPRTLEAAVPGQIKSGGQPPNLQHGWSATEPHEQIRVEQGNPTPRPDRRPLLSRWGLKVRRIWGGSTTIKGSEVEVRCILPWKSWLQNSRGEVFNCCYQSRPLGDVHEQTLEEIWQGKKAQAIRRAFLTGRIPAACRNRNFVGGPCPELGRR